MPIATPEQVVQILEDFKKLCPEYAPYDTPGNQNILIDYIVRHRIPYSAEVLSVVFLKTRDQMEKPPEKRIQYVQDSKDSGRINWSEPQPKTTATADLVKNVQQKAALASCLAALTVEISAARGTAYGLPHSRRPAAEKEAIAKVRRDFIKKYPQYEKQILDHEA